MDSVFSTGSSAVQIEHDALELLLAQSDALFRYALTRVGDRAAAEDLVQETLIIAVQNRHQFAGSSSPRTWLVGILRHRILNHYRWKARHPGDVPAAEHDGAAPEWFHPGGTWKSDPNNGLEALGEDPGRALERAEVRAALLDCVKRLPESVRRAYVLRELEELEPEEVCDVIAISRESLAVFLYRARQALRTCLQKKWATA